MSFEELIRKYRTNSLSLEELEEMRRQLSEVPLQDIERAMSAVYEEDGDTLTEKVSGEMADRVKSHIDREIALQMTETPDTPGHDEAIASKSTRGWKWLSVAAVLVAIVSAGLSFYLADREKRILAEAGYTEITTRFGEKARVTLPDGTVVKLTGRTMLRYPCDISLGNRNVDFNGEAYFEVSKDADHPFTVRANDITVKVTGTSFNLYARHDSKTDEVILDKGSVEIYSGSEDECVCLTGGESCVYDKESGEFDVVDFKGNPLLRRRVFGIRYENIQPEALIRSMEKTYGVSIDKGISSAINSPFTGVLPDDDINEALAILSKIYGFRTPYNREKR